MNGESFFDIIIGLYTAPAMVGVIFVILTLSALCCIFVRFPNSALAFLLDVFYEKVYEFYEEILGKDTSIKVKTFIVALFFIIFFTNILGVLLDFIAPVFGTHNGVFILETFIRIPSADLHFTLALGLVSIIVLVCLQLGSLGKTGFFLRYFPVNGNGYLYISKQDIHPIIYALLFPCIKTLDIMMSFFLSFLDMIGLVGKVVSLSFRLFGNIVSSGILLGMVIVGLSSFTESMTGFIGGVNFPIILPLIVYIQSLLIAVIQAVVFPLLVAIFIKVSQYQT